MKLSERLTPNRIRIPLASETKDEVLRELVSILPNHDDEARERILQAIVEREAKMSTGIGQGVAIPHGKCELVTEMGRQVAQMLHQDLDALSVHV